MKKFQFTLEKLLNYKEQLLLAAKTDLAKINRHMDDLLQEIYQNNGQQEQQNNAVHRLYENGVNPMMLSMHQRYKEKLQQEGKNLDRRKQFLQREQVMQAEKVKGINVEISSLSKLKEQEIRLYQQKEQKEQERGIEEFILSANLRKEAL